MNNKLFVKLFIKLLMSIIIANVLSFAFLKYGVNSKKNIQRVQINEIENALFRVKNVKSIVNNSYSITLFLEELDRTYEMYTNRVLVELGLRNEIFKILDLKFKSEIFIFKDESLIYNYSKGSLIYKFDKYTIDKYISKDSRFYFENKLNDHIFLGDSIKLLDGDYNFFVYFEPITKIEIDGIYVAIITSILFLFIYIMLSLSHIKYFKVILNEVKYMDRHIPVQGNDELSQIAYGINIIKDEIKKKIENEAKLEKSKQELIINISHDLRTPLTSIIGYLYLLKAKVDDDGREYIEVLEGQVNRLKILMDDLFEYVKLTDEKMPLNKNLVNFKDLIMQFAEENYYAIKERELNLELNICNEEIFLWLDTKKIYRVLSNLMNNAIKYSDEKSIIYLTVERNKEIIRMGIKNTCKMAENIDVDRIFERFYRENIGKEKGSGLGLAIAKGIVDLHGGKLYGELISKNEIEFIMEFIDNTI